MNAAGMKRDDDAALNGGRYRFVKMRQGSGNSGCSSHSKEALIFIVLKSR